MSLRPCWVEISTRCLENNYRFLRRVAPPDAELLAIVKADAYGHSLALCAPAAVRAGARWLGVTSVEEGAAARALCPEVRILVMGGIFPGQGIGLVKNRLTPVIWTVDQLEELAAAVREVKEAEPVPVHLEIDTGMSRQGVSLNSLPTMLSRIAAHERLRLEAVTTHLYASDETAGDASGAQLEQLEEALGCIRSDASVGWPKWVSVGASAALLGVDVAAIVDLAARWEMTPLLRPGLALYGLAPRYDPPFAIEETPFNLAEALRNLEPVLAWKTRVVSVREIPAGAAIGYNGTFVATEPMRIALLAVGYADGLDRRLGNHFSLLVRGHRAPLAGRISMDQAVLDVTEIEGVQAGDEVVIIGRQGAGTISAFDHAAAAETIPWEVFTRIGARVARIEV